MKEVTKRDLVHIIKRFDRYTETVGQHEFITLALCQRLIEHTNLTQIVKNQKNARAMYRSIAKCIGEDYSDYEEIN